MKPEMKKLIIANLPYLLFVYLFGKLGQAYRLAEGIDLSQKLLHFADGCAAAFESAAPSFHLFDLLIGVAGAAALRLMVYCKYVIENEAEFISQLKTVWNESKSKSANNGQQEIDEAKKRMAELDAKIQKLYDSAISGLLPERQAQRMIQQYDEEQLMLEKRVEELQGQIQEEEVEKIDTNRFIAFACYVSSSPLLKRSQHVQLPAKCGISLQKGQKNKRALRPSGKTENRGCFHTSPVSFFFLGLLI